MPQKIKNIEQLRKAYEHDFDAFVEHYEWCETQVREAIRNAMYYDGMMSFISYFWQFEDEKLKYFHILEDLSCSSFTTVIVNPDATVSLYKIDLKERANEYREETYGKIVVLLDKEKTTEDKILKYIQLMFGSKDDLIYTLLSSHDSGFKGFDETVK